MRGMPDQQMTMLSLVSPEQRVPQDHPIRKIKEMADHELARLSFVFDRMYSKTGRPSIPPQANVEIAAFDRALFCTRGAAVLRAVGL